MLIETTMSDGNATSEIVLFQNENFGGRSVSMTNYGSSDLGNDYNFNDKTSSIRVNSGIWLLYQDSGYNNTCWVVTPGEYPSPGTWEGTNDSISSLRPLPGKYGDIYAILFKNVQFGGRMVVFTQANANFADIDFNDQASSAIVLGGSWSVYKDADFGGKSWIISVQGGSDKNGRYPSYSGFFDNDAISSIQLNPSNELFS